MDLRILRHTSSHILAQALKNLYPDIKLAIGPSTQEGFYYDIDMDKKLTNEDFPVIEKEMKNIIKKDYKIEKLELSREEALEYMKDQPYKVEIINDIPEAETLTFFKQGDYMEMCRGPHLESTGKVNVGGMKLLSVAGAYWRGSEKNKMLQRVYGTAFETKEDLDNYLNMIEEAKKRDHRKLGKELELFTFAEEGPGFPFFLPKGKIVRNELEKYWREIHEKNGYQEISTPVILSRKLWYTSGHWDHYKDNMYSTIIDENEYAVKPMNCPGSLLVYKAKPHSYKEFPLKYGELGLVHRHENSGNLHGLLRVRCFTQDDAHIFMTSEQIETEIIGIIDLIDAMYKKMGFEYFVELSTRPEDSMGSDEDWETATESLKQALNKKEIPYTINEGDGAFYGPKIDFHIKDCLNRTWQCGTIQLDFQMPERFELEYTGSDGEKHRPVMVHRVIFGSIERFIGILIEHTAGKLPLWLSPIQVNILPIGEKHISYATEISNKLKKFNIRVELDDSNNTFGKKIREAALNKAPYTIIIGDKEIETNQLTVKNRDTGAQESIRFEDFMTILLDKRNNRL